MKILQLKFFLYVKQCHEIRLRINVSSVSFQWSLLVCFCYFLESVHTVKDSNEERMSKKSVDEFLKCQCQGPCLKLKLGGPFYLSVQSRVFLNAV